MAAPGAVASLLLVRSSRPGWAGGGGILEFLLETFAHTELVWSAVFLPDLGVVLVDSTVAFLANIKVFAGLAFEWQAENGLSKSDQELPRLH